MSQKFFTFGDPDRIMEYPESYGDRSEKTTQDEPAYVAIVTISDGTWDHIEGASVCIISAEQYEQLINHEIRTRDLLPEYEFGLAPYCVKKK